MLTKSFCVDIPKTMFKRLYRAYCEVHGHKVPNQNDEKSNKIFSKAIGDIWEEYGDDVCAFLDGNLPEYFIELDWDNSIEVAKAVAVMYIDYYADNPYLQIDLETYWANLMWQAMDAQEFFFTPEREAQIWGDNGDES